MKRIIALVLSLTFVFSLCGCKDGTKKDGNGVDIEYYANLGQISENEISLGTKYEDLKSALEKKQKEYEDKGEHYAYNEYEGENDVLISDGTYDYYYKKSDTNKSISYMISYTDAYGFMLGDIVVEVEKKLKDYEVSSEKANDTNAFFYIGDYSNAEILKVSFKENTVIFLFEDNALTATAIYSNDNWK